MDKAFYQCRASNGVDTIESTAIVIVNMSGGTKRPTPTNWDDDDYDEDGDDVGYLPESYSEPDFTGNRN